MKINFNNPNIETQEKAPRYSLVFFFDVIAEIFSKLEYNKRII